MNFNEIVFSVCLTHAMAFVFGWNAVWRWKSGKNKYLTQKCVLCTKEWKNERTSKRTSKRTNERTKPIVFHPYTISIGTTCTFGIGYRFIVAFNQSAIFGGTDTFYNQFAHNDSVINIVIFCSLSFYMNLHIHQCTPEQCSLECAL